MAININGAPVNRNNVLQFYSPELIVSYPQFDTVVADTDPTLIPQLAKKDTANNVFAKPVYLIDEDYGVQINVFNIPPSCAVDQAYLIDKNGAQVGGLYTINRITNGSETIPHINFSPTAAGECLRLFVGVIGGDLCYISDPFDVFDNAEIASNSSLFEFTDAEPNRRVYNYMHSGTDVATAMPIQVTSSCRFFITQDSYEPKEDRSTYRLASGELRINSWNADLNTTLNFMNCSVQMHGGIRAAVSHPDVKVRGINYVGIAAYKFNTDFRSNMSLGEWTCYDARYSEVYSTC